MTRRQLAPPMIFGFGWTTCTRSLLSTRWCSFQVGHVLHHFSQRLWIIPGQRLMGYAKGRAAKKNCTNKMKREGSFTILWTMPMLNGQNLKENINDNVSRFIRVRKKKKKNAVGKPWEISTLQSPQKWRKFCVFWSGKKIGRGVGREKKN